MSARPPSPAAPPPARGALPVLALGANTWLVAAGWPLLTTPDAGLVPWLAGALALSALAAGALLHRGGEPLGRRARVARDAASWLVFPIATASAAASAYDAARELALPLLPMLLGPLSACAYGAALVATTAPAPPPIAVDLSPLRVPSGPPRSSVLRAALPRVLFVAGAVALGLVLPALGDPATLSPRWGAASRPGSVLQAILGGALAAALLATFLPAALRRDPRDAEPRPDASLRTAWYLFLALLGAVTYYVVQT